MKLSWHLLCVCGSPGWKRTDRNLLRIICQIWIRPSSNRPIFGGSSVLLSLFLCYRYINVHNSQLVVVLPAVLSFNTGNPWSSMMWCRKQRSWCPGTSFLSVLVSTSTSIRSGLSRHVWFTWISLLSQVSQNRVCGTHKKGRWLHCCCPGLPSFPIPTSYSLHVANIMKHTSIQAGIHF